MGLFSSICDMMADTAETAVDVASSATKAGVRGVKKVANDAERVAKNVVDPFQIFHDDEEEKYEQRSKDGCKVRQGTEP